jgi:putative sigma-54 modulation protein
MKVQINAVGFTVDSSLTEFLQKKLNKLDTFYDRIIDSEVYLKLDKGEKLNTHKKRIEVKVNLPGDSIVVKETGTTFEEATDLAMDVLTRKVKQFKEKTNGIGRRKNVEIAEEIEEED